MPSEDTPADDRSRAEQLHEQLELLLVRDGLSKEQVAIVFGVLRGYFEGESRVTVDESECRRLACEKVAEFIARARLGVTSDKAEIARLATHYYNIIVSVIGSAAFASILWLINLALNNWPISAFEGGDWIDRYYEEFAAAETRGSAVR